MYRSVVPPGPHPDTVAAADAGSPQAAGQAPRLGVELAVGETPAGVLEGHPVWPSSGSRTEDVYERPGWRSAKAAAGGQGLCFLIVSWWRVLVACGRGRRRKRSHRPRPPVLSKQ